MPYARLFFIALLVLIDIQMIDAQALAKFEKWEQPGYFRGFNISDWNNLEDREATQGEFDSLKLLGANLVAIQTQGTLSDSFPYLPHVYYAEGSDTIFWQDVLDTLVAYARNADIQYVISVRTGPGRTDVGTDEAGTSTIWTNTTEQQLYGGMLREMAERYLPDTLFVGLDLTVEPNPLDSIAGESVEVLESALAANGIDVNAIYTVWIDSVRTVAPDLPLMVQGVHWSNPVYFSLVEKQADDRIVYKTHCYNPNDFSHADVAFGATYPGSFWSITNQDNTLFNQNFLSEIVYEPVRAFQQTHNVPIMIGEFGLQHPQEGGEQYLTDISDIACGYGWHFTYWNWNNTATFNYQYFDQTYGTGYMDAVGNSLTEPCVTAIGDDNPGTVNSKLPAACQLAQNYPNPFNPSTTITYALPAETKVTLRIFNVRGQLIRTLVNENQAADAYEIVWNGRDGRGVPASSGIYIYRLDAGELTLTRKMALLK